MNLRQVIPIFAVLMAVTLGRVEAIEVEVKDDSVSGKVSDDTTGQGVPRLIVKLVPPKVSKKPEKVTTTDQSGTFKFEKVEGGQYLLEIYQGLSLIYRDVIDTTKPVKKTITLQRKK